MTNTGTRTERDGFTYVSTCAYETDPASLLGVIVGDMVRVTDAISPLSYWAPQSRTIEFVVTGIGRDEFGLYLNGERGEYGNTVIHSIERVAP